MKQLKDIDYSEALQLLNAGLSGLAFAPREKIVSIDIDGSWVYIREEEKRMGKWFELEICISDYHGDVFVDSRIRLWGRDNYQTNQLALINKLKELGYLK